MLFWILCIIGIGAEVLGMLTGGLKDRNVSRGQILF